MNNFIVDNCRFDNLRDKDDNDKSSDEEEDGNK